MVCLEVLKEGLYGIGFMLMTPSLKAFWLINSVELKGCCMRCTASSKSLCLRKAA